MTGPVHHTAKKKILLIDDDADVAGCFAVAIEADGFRVETLEDPLRSIEVAQDFRPDLVVLSTVMSNLSGIQVCRMFRVDPVLKDVPVIFLSAGAASEERIHGLETGADDHICKSCGTRELVLRIRAVLNRVGDAGGGVARVLRSGAVLLDRESQAFTIQGREVFLTATEFRLLWLLMERDGRVQTREALLREVWGVETEVDARTVDTHVRRLREKLSSESHRLETIRSVGYRFAKLC
jgi:two-component system phosphate regulon response regulator PhoB